MIWDQVEGNWTDTAVANEIFVADTFSGLTFTLTTGMDNITGTSGNDVFVGTYNDAGTGTFNNTDVLNGNGGTDTLHITPIGVAAITPADAYWTGITGIEKIVIDTTGAGAQTITTGAAFQAAFAAASVDLTTTSNGGAITIDSSTFTGAATLTTSSGAGAQTITTGSGLAAVTATSTDGALTITGANLVTVTATSDAGAQTITSTGTGPATVTATSGAGAQTITGANLVTVTATSDAGAQTITSTGAGAVTVTASSGAGATTIVTGAGNDIITLLATGAAGANTITAGSGADTVTLVTGALAAPDTIVIGNTDSGITVATADSITGFATGIDHLKMGTAGVAGNYVAAGEGLADFTAAHTAADTALAGLAGAERYSFQWDATNGYLFNDVNGDGAADQVVVLVGITGATFAAADIIV